jgi:hypothetical protein
LSLAAIEAGIGIVLILAVAAGFGLGLPQPETQDAQLDAYATDATTVLSREAPRHAGATRLSEVSRSEQSFARERDALERRVERILPANLMFRVQTVHGSVGYERPTGVPVGHSTVTTLHGEVTIWVWYA